MAHHVMIDLETLGLNSSAVLLSLGAVKFDFNTLQVVDRFECFFRLSDQQEHGRTISTDTLRWWMQQSDDARQVFASSQELTNEQCLVRFNEFLRTPEPVAGVWGNGAAFDNALLRNFYYAYKLKPAWSHREDFCFRTFNAMFATAETRAMANPGVVHDALADAQFQTDILVRQIANLRAQGNQAVMLSRLLGAMSGMLEAEATPEEREQETSDGLSQVLPPDGDGGTTD